MVAQDPSLCREAVGKNPDESFNGHAAYGALVSLAFYRKPFVGFFAAVVVGSILSTFNSVLNSSATLFSLDVYKNFLRKDASTKEVVLSGQACSLVVAIFAVIAAPTVFYGRDAIFGFFQKLNGVYFIPILAIMLVGLVNRTANGMSAIITLVVGLLAMSIGTFLPDGWVIETFGSGYHFMGAVFLGLVILQSVLDLIGLRRAEPYEQKDAGAVDLTPWRPARMVGSMLIAFALAVYAYFAM